MVRILSLRFYFYICTIRHTSTVLLHFVIHPLRCSLNVIHPSPRSHQLAASCARAGYLHLQAKPPECGLWMRSTCLCEPGRWRRGKSKYLGRGKREFGTTAPNVRNMFMQCATYVQTICKIISSKQHSHN